MVKQKRQKPTFFLL
ncbi:unnamed protein product [Timema podura]|uniref:Uncharacterized protein n=1 Tax=Timema podura TaxID=61482 RepID=A0ABN7P7A6_TIMPD|nr:unnamed protein product [Timema podura]